MKVDVKIEPKELPFPKYMISNKGYIVFFISAKRGVVIDKGGYADVFVGEYADDWNDTIFTDFKGSITITQ